MIECLTTGIRRRDIIMMNFAKASGGVVVNEWSGNGIPCVVGFRDGAKEIQQRCLKEDRPFIFFDHAYFIKHGTDYTYSRICVNHFHTRDWRDSDRQYPECSEWKKGRDVIVIPPAGYAQMVYGDPYWLDETIETLRKNTDRKIIVKEKSDGALSDFFPKAHALVAYGSVAEVEAAIAGVPVFTKHGPSLPIAETDLAKIEAPIYPEREKWLRALSGAEYRIDEMDLAWERIRCLLPHTASFKQP